MRRRRVTQKGNPVEHLTSLRQLLPDWPEPPPIGKCAPDDQPVPAEQWPTLDLTWLDVPPSAADHFTGHTLKALLRADGALAPVAHVYWAPVPGARYGRGWLWRCRVHVVGAPCDSAASSHYDCRESGRSTTHDGARDGATAHIRAVHPDAAVPYAARLTHARRIWN
ncbi:hypothetical protein ABZ499_32930 [Streptomyces sp. NPDC019990]|uniref:hypothetical protein n=1 Tax=Streptomyces sp. NPDC019990 TaxID=3154693 RepID=UPI0033C665C8